MAVRPLNGRPETVPDVLDQGAPINSASEIGHKAAPGPWSRPHVPIGGRTGASTALWSAIKDSRGPTESRVTLGASSQ